MIKIRLTIVILIAILAIVLAAVSIVFCVHDKSPKKCFPIGFVVELNC